MNFFPNNNFCNPNPNLIANPFVFNNPYVDLNNPGFNQNFMNNQNQMNQMNLMNQMNVMNQMNLMNQIIMEMNQMMMGNMNNQNNKFIIQNPKNLVDKIINFYQEKNRIFMNYNEKYQISKLLENLDTKSPLLKEEKDIRDPLSYIKEKKKLIKFINHDFKIINVKVPISIDKMTLYQIADLYKSLVGAEFLLVYMNCILNKDESSIESISDGDFVIIIEDIYYLDDTYLNLLIDKNNIGKKKNVGLSFDTGLRINLIIPMKTKFSHLYKALILHFGFNYIFLYNGQTINYSNNDIVPQFTNIEIFQTHRTRGGTLRIFGKEIELKINLNNSIKKILDVGLLSSVKEFIKIIECFLTIKIKGFSLGKKEIYIKEDKSFASLGITNNCEIKLILEKNK